MDVAARIREYLVQHDISQVYLSEKTHISTTKLNLSLSNKRRLTFDEYQIICWALGVGVDTFMEPRPPENSTAS